MLYLGDIVVTKAEFGSISSDGKADAPVLIVGGGPTGLIAAGELLRRGVRCRLIDRLPVPHQTSNSFTLHSRTMEMIVHYGIAHRYLDTGIQSNAITFNFKNTQTKPLIDLFNRRPQ